MRCVSLVRVGLLSAGPGPGLAPQEPCQEPHRNVWHSRAGLLLLNPSSHREVHHLWAGFSPLDAGQAAGFRPHAHISCPTAHTAVGGPHSPPTMSLKAELRHWKTSLGALHAQTRAPALTRVTVEIWTSEAGGAGPALGPQPPTSSRAARINRP